MAARHVRLRWTTLYPLAGLVILWQQTFVADQAQPWLVMPALALMGIQIPLNYSKALQVLAENNAKRRHEEEEGSVDAGNRG